MQHDVPILTPELGINVNDKHQAFTEQILSGAKTIETRNASTLHPYIGKKMGLVRTGKGKAMLVGYVTIGEPKLYTAQSSFDKDFDSHLVGKDSPFHISKSKKGSKWGYTLSDVEKVEPRLLKDGTGVAPNPRVARKLQNAASPVRYAADQGEPSKFTMPSTNPASTSFGTAKNWVKLNDPHPIWHNQRSGEHNIGVVDHLSHGDERLSAIHFVAGHPAQMSPASFLDPNSDYPAQMKVMGVPSPHLKEASSAFPVARYNFHSDGETSHAPGRYQTGTMLSIRGDERDFSRQVYNSALSTNSAVLENLGITSNVTVNGQDLHSRFTPMFKDREAAERMAKHVGGYVQTIHFDPSRLRARGKPVEEVFRNFYGYEPQITDIPDPDQFQVIDSRDNPSTQRLDGSIVNIAKHPSYGEYLVTHNQSHLTSGPSFMRDTHFAGSLDKIDRQTFGSERYRANLSNPASRNFYQKENQKSYFTPFISQYWRNLIDLHSDFHNNDFGGRRDLSAALNNAGIDHTPPTRQLIDSMGDDARHLYAMALADHNEHAPRIILADLFDEHGHEGAANFMRASVPHQASGQVKLAKDSEDAFHTLVWHNSDTNEPIENFDINKASKTAVVGPAFYFSQNPGFWNLPGSKGVDRPYLIGGNIIDLTKPLPPEHHRAVAAIAGRNPEELNHFPVITLEHKFGSVAKGLEAAGFDGAWHLGPKNSTNLAMFKPHLIKPASASDVETGAGAPKRAKLAKDSKPDANWQPMPGAPVEVVSEIPGVWSTSGVYGGHADTPGKHVIEKTEGKYKGQEREIPEHRIYAPGGFAHMGPSVAQQQISPEATSQQPAQQAQRRKEFADNPPAAGDVIRIDSGLSGDRFHNGTYRVTPNHRGEIWHTNGRELSVEPVGNSPVNPSGYIPIHGRKYFMVSQAERQAPEPVAEEPQNSDAWHPRSGERVRIMGSDGQLSQLSHGVHYVYERPHAERNMHSVSVRTASGTVLGEDRTAANTIYHPTIDARLGQSLPRQLTPEQVADAHFNVGDDVHIRRDNGRIDTGTYRRINLTQSGDIEHVVSLSGNSGDVTVSPEDVWHWRGASSTHKAFTGPSSWDVVNNTIGDASPGRRIWVNTGFRDKGMENPVHDLPEFLNQYRRATLVNVNQDGTMSVRLDGGRDAVSVSPTRVRDNTDQSYPHVDTFNGSPISVVDTAGGAIYHGVYRGMARQSEGGQSVRSAIADAGLPYGENWTDPNRGSERFVHVAEINTPDGPLPVAVERSDILPRFAQGIAHNELNEDPRSAKGTLLKVASMLEAQGLAPDGVASMRERAAHLGTMPVRAINPPTLGSSTKAVPDKKLERIISNSGERNYQDVADSLRDKFREIFGENVDDETIMDILRVPRAFPGADPNHPAFSPENLELSASIYGDNVSSTVKSKLSNYKFHASTSVGSGNASNRSQSHSGARGTHDKFISTPHILQNQANAAHRLGIDHLNVSAALSNPVIDPHNGYTGGIVWPTYGYRKDLHAINDWDEIQLGEAIAIARRNNPDLHSVDDDDLTLNHLLDSKEGMDWYTQHEPHKNGGRYYPNVTDGHMEFDTNPNSISHRILARKTRRLEQNAASQRKPS